MRIHLENIRFTVPSLIVIAALACAIVPARRAEAGPPMLTQVVSAEVCMVTDRFFAKEQIPVETEGKTYYGCCQMCKKTLTENDEKHHAVDPHSGAKVDKATAVIAAAPDGNVFYFENETNLSAFNARLASAHPSATDGSLQ